MKENNTYFTHWVPFHHKITSQQMVSVSYSSSHDSFIRPAQYGAMSTGSVGLPSHTSVQYSNSQSTNQLPGRPKACPGVLGVMTGCTRATGGGVDGGTKEGLGGRLGTVTGWIGTPGGEDWGTGEVVIAISDDRVIHASSSHQKWKAQHNSEVSYM